MTALADWNFQREIELPIPHQLALPPLDEEGVSMALGLLADRFTPVDNHTLDIERLGRPGTVRLDLLTLHWQARPCMTEGRGLIELGTWLRRSDLLGTACMLGLGILALRGGH